MASKEDLMIQKLDSIDERLIRMEGKQVDQAETLAKNTASLEDHIRRTELLEQDMKPIKRHVEIVNWTAKLGLTAVTVAEALHKMGLF